MKHIIGTFKTMALGGAFAMLPFCIMANEEGIDKKKKNQPEAVENAPEVEVVSFTGRLQNNKVDLQCKVKSNCCYSITVERSRNGKRFSGIGNFSDNKQLAEYTFLDDSPLKNTNYYRLRVTDNKGNVSYSRLMVVQLYNTEALSMVSVTPNTALQDIHINVQLKNRAFVVMKITDEKGREVIQKRLAGKEGLNTYELEGTHTMIPGNYSLEVRVNNTDQLLLPLIKE
ncbi:MAG: hypothetical protein KF862_11385 [Chitinophagaceae bacterium]|nr:hypothetical protein [Chitinophagaceae bacterium]